MKKSTLFILLLAFLNAFSQDVIIKKNGEEITAKVIEITDESVKYKKWDDSPVYSLDKAQVFKIKYENGQSDFFGAEETTKGNSKESSKEKNKEVVKETKASTAPKKQEKAKPVAVSEYPKPTTDNVPYFYDEYTNSLIPLEKVKFTTERIRSGAWGKHDIIILPATASTVTVKKTKATKFIIRFTRTESELYTNCLLNTTEVNKKLARREWVMATRGARGAVTQHDEVQVEFKPIGDSADKLYLITLSKKMDAGELFFHVSNAEEVYAFSYK